MSSKIKLLHLTSSLKIGGAERVLYEVVTTLDSEKYDQVVVYFHGGPYEQLFKEKNIPLVHIKGLFFRYDPVFWLRLLKAILQLNPDKMHTLLWMANVAGRIIGRAFKIPTYSVMHNNVTQDGKVRSFIDHVTLSKADHIIAVSYEVRDSLCARHRWLPAHKIPIITNGVDSDRFARAAITMRQKRSDFGFADWHVVVGTVGRFASVKQYDLLLKSFAAVYKKFPHIRLMLVGTGPQEQLLRNLSTTLEINSAVYFIIGKSAIDYYGIFDCFVMSSAQEGISIALLEAMSSSLACVVTNAKAPEHSVLTHGTDGLVVSSNNQTALQEGLEMLIIDPALRSSLGKEACKTVKLRFQKQEMVACYDQLFSDGIQS
jgi:glycosyltransferase involved in cell wall biosynthesis